MSAVVQLVDSADQQPQSKAERAREAATAAWQNHREYEAALEALKADASRLRKACSDAEETEVARAEQKVTAEAAIEPARLAIGAAANEGRDTQPLFEDLRSKEAAAYLAKYQHAAAIRDAQKAVADKGQNVGAQAAAKSRIESALKRAIDCEKAACYLTLVEVGERFDVRTRDLACLPALELFRRQGTAAILGHPIPRA